MTDETSPWETLASQRYYECPYLTLDEDRVRHRSGKVHPYTAVRFRVFGVAILPILPDGSTYLVGQYRHVSQRYTWELPRGGAALDHPAESGARRELIEEVGLAGGQWLEVLRVLVSPGISDEWAPCFIAWDLERVERSPDEQEDLTIRRVSMCEAITAALDGTITDAASVATLLAAHVRAQRNDLPQRLLSLLAAK